MSIYQELATLQLRNKVMMEEIEDLTVSCSLSSCIEFSNCLFTDFIKAQILCENECYNFSEPEIKNAAIIKLLKEDELNAEEAAAQSNSIWIEYINKLRAPGAVIINLTNYRNNNYLEPKF